ncbi:calcium-activated chloride channel regulator 1-like [Ptychodera flava]|uniref:calcium-activated chloride channel regulator 1-like n=1 Tax=Ptychodera flava TaxID=63121 RepID=UPI003969D7C0
MRRVRTAVLILLLGVFGQKSLTTKAPITLQNGEYSGILVAIHNNIPEDEAIIERIKAVLTEGSEFLLTASKRRAYFKEVTILIPKTWESKPEYSLAKDESFERAHVIVDEPNPAWGNNPYTLQLGGCGVRGEYIHYTPSYLLDEETSEYIWGPAGRLLVHEWGHLRYGLFDEYFTTYDDPGVEPFYLDRRERLQGTRCSLEIAGVNRDAETFTQCAINPRTGLPVDGCIFFPNLEGQTASASIMFAQYLDPVTTWCHSNASDPSGLHNRDAPNKQNNLCGGKSTLDVILTTQDFAGNSNPPIDDNKIVTTVPNFRLVQRRERRVVLVLDVSGSMEGEPLTKLLQVCTKYLRNTIDDGSYVGIVEFRGTAEILSQLRLISGSNSREALVSSLPKVAEGWTSIGGGIRKGIEVLSSGLDGDPTGGYILLVSDGGENRGPLIRDVRKEIDEAGVIIDTVAFSDDADRQLESLASDTGGMSYFFSGSDDTSSLYNAFTSTVTKRPEEATANALPIQLASAATDIPSQSSISGSVFIDSSLGNSTVFGFTWRRNKVDVVLTGPDGSVTNKTNTDMYKVDEALKMISIAIPDTAMSGKWTYVITNPSNEGQVINIGTESRRVTEDAQPIVVTSYLSSPKVDFRAGTSYMIVYAKATKGHSPVVNAEVFAIVDQGSNRVTRLRLLDNGAGADITRNDGVYSAYFVNITGNGRYSVQIKVENTDGSAQVRKSGKVGGGAFPFRPGTTSKPSYEQAELFNRATSAGTFEVANYNEEMAQSDMYAPARIIDLEVVFTSFENRAVTLQWIAPGDDFDQGTATKYDLRVSDSVDVLYDSYEQAHQLKEPSVIEGSLTQPLPAGSREKITVMLAAGSNITTNRLAFAIRAIDDAGASGDTSNVAIATFYDAQEDNTTIIIIACVVVLLVLLVVFVIVIAVVILRRRSRPKDAGNSSMKQYSEVATSDSGQTKKAESEKKKPVGGFKVLV